MNYLVTLMAAEGHAPPPLVDIDATLFVQLGLFLLLWLVLSKLVFGPYLRVKHEQEAQIEGGREEAGQLNESSDTKLADYERRLAEARKEAASGRAKARAEGQDEANEALVDARKQAEEKLNQARAKIADSVPAAENALRAKGDELARSVAARVLGRDL